RFTKLNQPKTDHKMNLEFGGLVISPDQRTVNLYGENIELTPKEFDILHLLASHPKKVYSVENIFQHVWDQAYFESGNTVMVHIRTLRKKLEKDTR
ncbi:winged helix-turn-helix domain-containing protein, partial [Bacillus sp. mrc49]